MARPRFALVMPALIALSVAFSADAEGKKYRIGAKDKTSVTFKVGGPAGLGTITGNATEMSLEDRGADIVIKVPLAGFKTGIDERDKHFRQKLGGKEWPDASLVVPKGSLKVPGGGTAKGTFKIHGVQKEKTFKYTAKKTEEGLLVTGSFTVDVFEHGFKEEDKTFCFLKICTKNIVEVNASFVVAEG